VIQLLHVTVLIIHVGFTFLTAHI